MDMGDLFQPPLSILDAANLGIELFGESGLRAVIEDLNESVFPARSAGLPMPSRSESDQYPETPPARAGQTRHAR